MAQPRVNVPAPPVTPSRFGLTSAALVVDDLDGHAQMGVQYEPEACGNVHETRAACDAEAAELDQSHTGIPLIEGDPFNLYTLFRCNPVGLGAEGLRAKAGESLRNGESRAIEHAVADRLPLTVGAVDLTPVGGAVHPVDGLALLEGYAARYYGGTPVLHVPRSITTILGAFGGARRETGGPVSGLHLETLQGSLVASGGGYYEMAGPPTDAEDPETIQAPGEGEAWLYVTGTVVIRRASTVQATPLAMSRFTAGDGDSLAATNDALVLAVRPYVATWECLTAAVLVTSPFGFPTFDGGGA